MIPPVVLHRLRLRLLAVASLSLVACSEDSSADAPGGNAGAAGAGQGGEAGQAGASGEVGAAGAPSQDELACKAMPLVLLPNYGDKEASLQVRCYAPAPGETCLPGSDPTLLETGYLTEPVYSSALACNIITLQVYTEARVYADPCATLAACCPTLPEDGFGCSWVEAADPYQCAQGLVRHPVCGATAQVGAPPPDVPVACCYDVCAYERCQGTGRPLVVEGAVRVAARVVRSDW